jgi:hypothetical protein
MAYAQALTDTKCRHCPSRASMEVFNRFNGSMGRFCKKCAALMVKMLKEEESKDK